ncbi:hypothetical protein FJSC11DRAFT_0801 [Fischerella thermalis JSC-11]|uniref:Uncharacterized protein n=1 Tax=Fischerella thermalis JSC-11 TaxID=741277 RepID=G6FPM1_9CYAN|nr:hypothetical protein FJSC11DRAFT_0801 [Fischerella thermalis JSC-11]
MPKIYENKLYMQLLYSYPLQLQMTQADKGYLQKVQSTTKKIFKQPPKQRGQNSWQLQTLTDCNHLW